MDIASTLIRRELHEETESVYAQTLEHLLDLERKYQEAIERVGGWAGVRRVVSWWGGAVVGAAVVGRVCLLVVVVDGGDNDCRLSRAVR
jgi:hypothetical protein